MKKTNTLTRILFSVTAILFSLAMSSLTAYSQQTAPKVDSLRFWQADSIRLSLSIDSLLIVADTVQKNFMVIGLSLESDSMELHALTHRKFLSKENRDTKDSLRKDILRLRPLYRPVELSLGDVLNMMDSLVDLRNAANKKIKAALAQ